MQAITRSSLVVQTCWMQYLSKSFPYGVMMVAAAPLILLLIQAGGKELEPRHCQYTTTYLSVVDVRQKQSAWQETSTQSAIQQIQALPSIHSPIFFSWYNESMINP